MSKRTFLGRKDGSTVHVRCPESMAEDLRNLLAKGPADGPALEELNNH